jgi:hypothetical protein
MLEIGVPYISESNHEGKRPCDNSRTQSQLPSSLKLRVNSQPRSIALSEPDESIRV